MSSNSQSTPFDTQKKGFYRTLEAVVIWGFRACTWAIIVAAAAIFLTIIVKGLPILLSSEFPFINTDFLSRAPETLHIFEYEGETYEMADTEFREFQEGVEAPIDSETYAHAGGGVFPAIVGTMLLVLGSMIIALVMGVLSAIYLSEYSKPGKFIDFIRLSVLNLAGVPSIVYGLFGFGLFVVGLNWNVSLLSGWFTLAIMVLPIIITASEEALKAVPNSFREGSLSLGASKWQTIRRVVLPYALPGILTSSILGVARVAGETAPIMFTAAYAVRDSLPWEVTKWTDFFFQGVMALPYHIYIVSSKIPQNEYTERMQYGAALVLLLIVFSIALISMLLRAHIRKQNNW